jgi:hypothetical protein
VTELSPEIQELVDKCDPDTKLAVTAWVISKIDDFGRDPGSFRHLIYTLMGFGPEAYMPIYFAGGMNITNELDYSRSESLAQVLQEEGIDNPKVKAFAGLCDEPGCYDPVSCGTPTPDGYRNTCYEHKPDKGP